MIESVYLLFSGMAVLLMVLSFSSSRLTKDRKEIPYFAWLTMFLAVFLSLMSAQIEIPICDNVVSETEVVGNLTNYTRGWDCAIYEYEAIPLIWFWVGIGIIMFILAVYQTFVRGTEAIME